MNKREVRKIVRWFKKEIGLDGWEIVLCIGEPSNEIGGDILPRDRNDWYGRALPIVQSHKAVIWLNPEAHSDGTSETETVLHELVHTFFGANGIQGGDDQQVEWVINRLARILAKQYA